MGYNMEQQQRGGQYSPFGSGGIDINRGLLQNPAAQPVQDLGGVRPTGNPYGPAPEGTPFFNPASRQPMMGNDTPNAMQFSPARSYQLANMLRQLGGQDSPYGQRGNAYGRPSFTPPATGQVMGNYAGQAQMLNQPNTQTEPAQYTSPAQRVGNSQAAANMAQQASTKSPKASYQLSDL